MGVVNAMEIVQAFNMHPKEGMSEDGTEDGEGDLSDSEEVVDVNKKLKTAGEKLVEAVLSGLKEFKSWLDQFDASEAIHGKERNMSTKRKKRRKRVTGNGSGSESGSKRWGEGERGNKRPQRIVGEAGVSGDDPCDQEGSEASSSGCDDSALGSSSDKEEEARDAGDASTRVRSKIYEEYPADEVESELFLKTQADKLVGGSVHPPPQLRPRPV